MVEVGIKSHNRIVVQRNLRKMAPGKRPKLWEILLGPRRRAGLTTSVCDGRVAVAST